VNNKPAVAHCRTLPSRLNCGVSSGVSLSVILGISLFLSACGTPSPSQSSNSNASPNNPPERAEPFSALTTAALRTELSAKGWLYQGESKGGPMNALYFVRPQSLLRVGNYARYSQLEVRETPVKLGAEWVFSSVSTVQMDCVNRTRQTLAAEVFADRSSIRKIGASNNPFQPAVVRIGSPDDIFLLRACSGNFSGGQFAAVPGSAGARPPANSSGSGIVLARGTAVTNQHVVASCAKVDVIYEGRRLSATVKKRDTKNDLALLEVADLSALVYPSLRRRAVSGEGVMVAGYPLAGLLSSDMIVTDGIVNALSGLSNNGAQLQISAPVQPGNSGGPLIDKSGAVVGVVVSKLNALRAAAATGDLPQNVNFAIKPEVLRQFLDTENVVMSSSDAGQRLETEVLAERAKAFTLKVECKNS
jgi:S1-C subfamily serine protease